MTAATDTETPARKRLDRYVAMAPAAAQITITEETTVTGGNIAQAVIRGTIDTVLITIGNRKGRTRTRVTARSWFNSGGKDRLIQVGYLSHRVRDLFVS